MQELDADYVSCISDLERSRVFHGVIGVFECDKVKDVRETYAQYQAAAKRVMQLAGIPNPACRLFGFGSDHAVQACRDAVLSNKEMEGLAALTRQEIEDSVMLGFCMLDFAGCMHMNIAKAVLELQHKEMSLDTPVDHAFGCAPAAMHLTCCSVDSLRQQRTTGANGMFETCAIIAVIDVGWLGPWL